MPPNPLAAWWRRLFRRSRAHLDPSKVFTPSDLPLGELNVYASREDEERHLDEILRRHQIPLVFGEYGVGKTTLIRKRFQPAEREGRLIYVPSVAQKTLGDIFKIIFEHTGYTVKKAHVEETSSALKGSLEFEQLRISHAREGGRQEIYEAVVSSPTDQMVLRVMEQSHLVLILDEMHKASDELRYLLADFLKGLRSANIQSVDVVLIGTTTDAEHLVRRDPGIDRHVKELMVDPLDPDEAEYIIQEGMARLNLTIHPDLVATVVETASGAPTIVQFLGLEMASKAQYEGRRETTIDDYEYAVRKYLDEHGRRLYSKYAKAIETTGPRRYRKQILRAMSEIPADYATMEDIRFRVSRYLQTDVPSTSLSGPLRDLKDERFGRILQDVERFDAERAHNLTAFSDPMMKSFIRFVMRLEEQDLHFEDREFGVED